MKELQKNQNYYFNQHSCFLLQYHSLLITKYQKSVLVNKITDFFLNYTRNYFTERDLNILEINTNDEYVHILFECRTNINLFHFVNAFKSSSSRMIRKNFLKNIIGNLIFGVFLILFAQ